MDKVDAKQIAGWLRECEDMILKKLHDAGMDWVRKGDFHLELFERIDTCPRRWIP